MDAVQIPFIIIIIIAVNLQASIAVHRFQLITRSTVGDTSVHQFQLIQASINNNGYLQRLTRTVPKSLHILYM